MFDGFRVLIARVLGLLGRRRVDRDFERELDAHLALLLEENIRRGMTPGEARRAARVRLGGVTQLRETHRDLHGLPWFETLGQDFRYALRMVRKNPGFTVVVVLTLGLGIGANTAIFSLVDAFLLRQLPVRSPEQLVLVKRVEPKGRIGSDFPYPVFEQLRDRNRSFSGMFAWDDSNLSVTVDGQPEFVSGDFVSGSYFDMLGVGARLGRTFTAADDQAGKAPVAVISDAYWKRRFSQNPAVIGKTIYLAGTPFTVIGVTPSTFFGRNVAGGAADVTLPMFVHPWLALKDHDTFSIMARLKPSVALTQAQADLDLIYHDALTPTSGGRLPSQVVQKLRVQKIALQSGSRGADAGERTQFAAEMRILMCVVGVALLIACANVANLLLARSSVRSREMAVRLAIGASRRRLIRQLLSESVFLALLGGVAGFLFATWGVSALVAVLAEGGDGFSFGLKPDLRILAFTAAISLITGILFGLVPAFSSTRVLPNPILKGTEGAAVLRPLRSGLGKPLVVAQVALSLALLVGAGLLVRTLLRIYNVETGFDRDRVWFGWVFPALNGYDHAKEMNLYREVLGKMNIVPGIRSATLSRYRQFVARPEQDVWIQGAESSEPRNTYYNLVAPRFFATMGIPQLLGRDISPSDGEAAPKVAVVSETFARTFFQNQNPIGRHIGFNGPASSGDVQIVGVVGDTKHHLLENQTLEAVYIPYTQGAPEDYGQMNLVFRTTAQPAGAIEAIRKQVLSVDRNLPVRDVETAAADLDEYLGDQRSLATLMGFFGVLALALAAIGLYGTMSYAVASRTRELGIRIALGAESGKILRMILRETLSLVALGAMVGLPLAVASKRLIASMLFGAGTIDPIMLAVAVLVMLAAAALAGYIPARRATKVDPMVALRYE